MKITTNYSKHEWKKVTIQLIIVLIITGGPAIAYTQTLFIPILDEFIIWLDFVNENEIIKQYAEESVNQTDMENISEYDLTIKLLAVLTFGFGYFIYAGPVMAVLPFIFWFWISPGICSWIIKKTNQTLIMKLVIFKDGKPLGQKKK